MDENKSGSSIDRASAALVGAALGNAIGWRLDPTSHNTSKSLRAAATLLKPWKRKVGSGKNRYIELIGAGEFNGTVTFSMALARSIASIEWMDALVEREIPFVTRTARSIPQSDLTALSSWEQRVPPWKSETSETVATYLNNRSASAAIHTTPLAATAAFHGNSPNQLSSDALRVVQLTHGHADAHVAAVILSQSIRWLALLDRTLEFGELLAVATAKAKEWLSVPNEAFLNVHRGAAADRAQEQWEAATQRMIELCTRGADQIEAPTFSQENYLDLDAISAQSPGAVQTVASALYLFSKGVANPMGALTEAATSLQWDLVNGTAAVGSLLGALGGSEALGSLAREVQDRDYLESLVRSGGTLNPRASTPSSASPPRWAHPQSLDGSDIPDTLPDGRPLTLVGSTALKGTARNRQAVQHRVNAGISPTETIYIVTVGDAVQPLKIADTDMHVVAGLPVRDLAVTRQYYEDLGFHSTDDSKRLFKLGDSLIFYQPTPDEPGRIVISVSESAFAAVAARASKDSSGTIRDPDGRIVDIRVTPTSQHPGNKSQLERRAARSRVHREAPVFIPRPDSSGYPVSEETVAFETPPGRSKREKTESVRRMHEAADARGLGPLLDISTKSPISLGVALSAFNLTLLVDGRGELPVEVVYQGGKVFRHGGPFTDLYDKTPRQAKSDKRLRPPKSLIKFSFEDHEWPLTPPTAFYDYLYLRALLHNPGKGDELMKYNAFTDIEFNPKRSRACQARSATLYVALRKRETLELAMQEPEAFIREISTGPGETTNSPTLFDV